MRWSLVSKVLDMVIVVPVGRNKKWRLEEKLAGRALVGNEKIIRELRVSR